MFTNVCKIVLRLMQRNRVYSFINFMGLSLGLFTFILIFLFVRYEFSYDRYHAQYENIYRVFKEGESEYMGSRKYAIVQSPLADVLKTALPEVDKVSRILSYGNLLVTVGDQSFFEDKYFAVDPDFFKIFSLEIVAGNTRNLLNNPHSVVIDETLAKKYFGKAENAIGKTISAETHKPLGDYVVEGVFRDMPANSHFRMHIVFSFVSIVNQIQPSDLNSWSNSNYWIYLTMKPDVNLLQAELKLNESVKSHFNQTPPRYAFQPLHDIYLGEKMNFELASTGNLNRLYTFMCIGILVLIIACINYMNMTTAQTSKRAKEIGLRKVNGALRGDLVWQFIGEALVIAALSMLFACIGVLIMLPLLNTFLEKEITFSIHSQPELMIGLPSLICVVGVIAGAYPAFVFANLKPVSTLKGAYQQSHTSRLRDVLVVLQFVVSGSLIFSTLVVWRQMQFISQKNLGFDRQQVVIVKLRDEVLKQKASVIKEKLAQHPNILKVSASMRTPSNITSNQGREWPAKEGKMQMSVYYSEIDSSFLDVYDIRILAGENISASSHRNDALVNETLVKELGYTNEEVIGMIFNHGDSTRIIGVVNDFHFQDFRQKIQPLRMRNFVWGPPGYLSIKVQEHDIQSTLKYIEATLNDVSDKFPFEYSFYDDMYMKVYAAEQKTAQLMTVFAAVAIVIAMMGLYALVMFIVNQRLREIGIRKVLGASSPSLVSLLTQHFFWLTVIGYTVACCIGYYATQAWLNTFAYQVSWSIDVFLITFMAIIAVTGSSIFSRIRYALNVNPSNVLKID